MATFSMEKFHYEKKKTLFKNNVIVVNLDKSRTLPTLEINMVYEWGRYLLNELNKAQEIF